MKISECSDVLIPITQNIFFKQDAVWILEIFDHMKSFSSTTSQSTMMVVTFCNGVVLSENSSSKSELTFQLNNLVPDDFAKVI